MGVVEEGGSLPGERGLSLGRGGPSFKPTATTTTAMMMMTTVTTAATFQSLSKSASNRIFFVVDANNVTCYSRAPHCPETSARTATTSDKQTKKCHSPGTAKKNRNPKNWGPADLS